MRKHIARALTVLAVAAMTATLAPAPAHADHGCVGSSDVPEAWVCYVRFQVEAPDVEWEAVIDEPGQTYTLPTSSIYLPGQTFTVGSETHEVPSETQTVPRFCATTLICVESFDVTTPYVSQTTPELESNTLPVQPLPDDVLVPVPPVYVEAPVLVMPQGSLLVLWYMDECYYVWPDGDITTVDHTGNSDTCP